MDQEATFVQTVNEGVRSFLTKQRVELALLVSFIGCTFAVVCLMGHDPLDPVAWGEGERVTNPCGPVGAWLSHHLFLSAGYGAWLTFGGMVFSLLTLAGRPFPPVGTRLAMGTAVLTSLAFLQLALPTGAHMPAGGMLGKWLVDGMVLNVGVGGTWILLAGAAALQATKLFDLRWDNITSQGIVRAEALGTRGMGLTVSSTRSLMGWSFAKSGQMATLMRQVGQRLVNGMGSGFSRMGDSLARARSTEPDAWNEDYLQEAGDWPSDAGESTRVGEHDVAEVEWLPTENRSYVRSEVLDLFPEMGAAAEAPRSAPDVFVADPRPATDAGRSAAEQDVTQPDEHPFDEVPPSDAHLRRSMVDSAPVVKAELSESIEVPSAPDVSVGAGVNIRGGKFLEKRYEDDGGAVAKSSGGVFRLPKLMLLDPVPQQHAVVDGDELRTLARKVEETLASFKVSGEVIDVRVGPVVTTFEYLPQQGVSVRKISGLADDLAMSLCAMSVRIVAPIPGRGVVGIEIPSKSRLTIYLRELLASPQFSDNKHALPVALGKDVEGAPVIEDLAKMPHLLVGGTTGAGKSVGVNGMLLSLLFTRTPEELRLLLVDPKKLEFKLYEGIPHLLHPVVTEPKLAAAALAWACREMDSRYELLARWDTRNIESYNKKVVRESQNWTEAKARRYAPDGYVEGMPLKQPARLPYIVVVIDELADLMMIAKKEVEVSIARLTQMARACGIHVIVATQRPSVDVITGLIKSNLPTRLSFKLRTVIDSRTVLDSGGAESLLGRGDCLYLPNAGDLKRCHGAFVSDEEVERLVQVLRKQGEPMYVDGITVEENGLGPDVGDLDPLFDSAVEIVQKKGKASTSMIQRHLKIGYNRAARIVDQMEGMGIIGPADGARPRAVLLAPPVS